jgi:hypothetical protein
VKDEISTLQRKKQESFRGKTKRKTVHPGKKQVDPFIVWTANCKVIYEKWELV